MNGLVNHNFLQESFRIDLSMAGAAKRSQFVHFNVYLKILRFSPVLGAKILIFLPAFINVQLHDGATSLSNRTGAEVVWCRCHNSPDIRFSFQRPTAYVRWNLLAKEFPIPAIAGGLSMLKERSRVKDGLTQLFLRSY